MVAAKISLGQKPHPSMLNRRMEPIEIEEMVAQDAQGVVYLARMLSSDTPVALHRFFPFGKDSRGFDEREEVEFGDMVSRLAQLEHPALCRVLAGAVDPIDRTPFLVSEWGVGASLRELLNGEKLDPATVGEIMRHALEVSLVVSEVLGQEGLWITPDQDSIFVGGSESELAFGFRLSPLRLLAPESERCDFLEFLNLGEELAGWKDTLVSARAGNGLGGWFQWLKETPQASVRQALESLTTTVGQEPLPPEAHAPQSMAAPAPTTALAPTSATTVVIKQKSSKAPFFIVGVLSLLVITLLLGFFLKGAKGPASEEPLVQQNLPTASDATEQPAAAKTTPVATATETADLAPQAAVEARPVILRLTPNQYPLMRRQKIGIPIELTGRLKEATFNRDKTVITLKFEKGKGTARVFGVISEQDYQGEFSIGAMRPYFGKVIRLRGLSNPDRTGKSRDVLIRRFQDIVLVEN